MKKTRFAYLVWAWIGTLILGMVFMFAFVGYANSNHVTTNSIEFMKLMDAIWLNMNLFNTLAALNIIGTIFLGFWGLIWILIIALNAANTTFRHKNQGLWIATFFIPPVALFDK